jgi:hypothetical protein
MKLDSQQIGIIGKQIVIANLLAANLEVAVPIRDRGIDLIVYQDRAEEGFKACPLQLKTSSDAMFGLDSKYEHFKNLRIVFVWNAKKPSDAQLFALTYEQAISVLTEMKFDRTDSWKKGRYVTTRPSQKLKKILENRYEVKRSEDWPARLGISNTKVASTLSASS